MDGPALGLQAEKHVINDYIIGYYIS